MPSSRLSVGIAASQDTSALQRVLESVFAQERAFDQVVVSLEEGGRATEKAIKAFSKRVEIVHVSPDLTPVQQWNCMAPHLNGDWLSFLTPEDCLLPHFARAVHETVTATPGASILRAGWLRLRENRPGERYTLHSVRAIVKPAEALYEQRFGPKGSFSACAIRREIWEKAGLFPQETPLLGDWAMWLLAGALGDTIRSREVIAEHRQSPQTLSADASRKTEEIRETFLIYRDILPRATTWAGLENTSWIASASRKRFRDVAIAASSKFNTHLRGPLVQALRPWAESVEQEALLSRLETGEKIPDFNLARRMKPAIKRVISAVR